MRRFLLPLLASACLLAGPSRPIEAGTLTYLSLGDSLAFGVGADDSSADISNGNRGYVSLFANTLAARNGGVTPNVINLGVSGETSSSFFGNGVGLDGSTSSAKHELYREPIAFPGRLDALDDPIPDRGGQHDLDRDAHPRRQRPLRRPGQRHLDPQALMTFQTNEMTLLSQIQNLLPNTNLILLGYYDPYPPSFNQPNSPYYQLAQASAQAIPAINQYIAADAAAVNGTFVNLQPVFAGNELNYTYIATGNVHPNLTGYQAIGTALAQGTVPEPSTVILLGMGILPLAYHLRKTARRMV